MPLWLSAGGKALGAFLGWLLKEVAPMLLAYLAGRNASSQKQATKNLEVKDAQLKAGARPPRSWNDTIDGL